MSANIAMIPNFDAEPVDPVERSPANPDPAKPRDDPRPAQITLR